MYNKRQCSSDNGHFCLFVSQSKKNLTRPVQKIYYYVSDDTE